MVGENPLPYDKEQVHHLSYHSLLSPVFPRYSFIYQPDSSVRNLILILIIPQGATVSKDYVMRGRDNHVLNLNKTLKQACVQDGEILMIGLLG